MKQLKQSLLFLILLVAMTTQSIAAEKIRILFLLDASYSMKKNWNDVSKWQIAINTLSEIADSVSNFENVEMGLRVFGHLYNEPEANCKDSKLEVPIGLNNGTRIRFKLNSIKPKGITPIAYSIEKAANDFGAETGGKNILIIITDGEEACEGDPCKASLALQQNNIVLKPFIIGMSLTPDVFERMNCIGAFVNTNSKDEFDTQLKKVVNEAIAKTTLQVNLNDLSGKPTETDANMSFYDAATGQLKYNFYHTLNARGLPDTISVSPLFTYNIQVHTIPELTIENVELKSNQHNTVQTKAAQGFLNFIMQGNPIKSPQTDRIKCIVHLPNDPNTLNVQKLNSKEKYLVGTYDLELLTLPRIYLKKIKVDQSKVTEVSFPAPGILTLNKPYDIYGSIFTIEQNKVKKLYELNETAKQETIALQPGKYKIVYRAKSSHTIHTSVDKDFEIMSGGSLVLKL